MEHIAAQKNRDKAKRAAVLSKADLTTELVGEFPELQGIAGYYYAMHDGEDKAVAVAIKEHYQPRFSGDALPETELGCALALADRLDTLAGIFKIGLLPTGDKDPYGLRRAAMGVLRILIEKKMNLDVRELLRQSTSENVTDAVWNFMLDRLQPWYQEHNTGVDVFRSVSALNISMPYDIDCRIQAVQSFKKLPEAGALSIANKRVSNILTQYEKPIQQKEIDEHLFEHDAERELAKRLNQQVK
jgi:glycyl-tRNA synthetase beta chain